MNLKKINHDQIAYFFMIPLILMVLYTKCFQVPQGKPLVMGIKSEIMNFHAAEQQATNWCWAASVQMVLSCKGISVFQSEVVRLVSDGAILDRPGTADDIAANLNGRLVDEYGYAWKISCRVQQGPPSFAYMKQQFAENMPMLIAYANPYSSIGHAVVITAVIYEETPQGPKILKILVRDPWPDYKYSLGKRELSASEFEQIYQHYLVTASSTW